MSMTYHFMTDTPSRSHSSPGLCCGLLSLRPHSAPRSAMAVKATPPRVCPVPSWRVV